jgi:lysozyme family protein
MKTQTKISIAALAMITSVIAVEGGYVFHPHDPGGETNMGVTKNVALQHGYTGPMRTLPRSVVESIYYQSYLVKPGYEQLIPLDAVVVEELFDTTVNMGPKRPSRWFQQELNAICGTNLVLDGEIGPASVRAFAWCQGIVGRSTLCVRMLDGLDRRQKAEYDRLVRVNPKLKTFHRGWVNHRIGNVSRARCRSQA